MPRMQQNRIGDPPQCSLLVTGQTTQYSGEKDDGYYEKGKSRLFVVLSSGQYSGTVDITLNAKTHALSNNCVLDKKTGLVWARYVPNADIGPDNDGKLYWKEGADAENIFRFCDEANSQGLGGHNDWRVPNYNELVSLIDVSVNTCIDTTAFPSSPGDSFWTSTTERDIVANALRIYMGNYPATSFGVKATTKYYCRLVRGPKF